jgi:hypothetical protein
MFNLFNLRQVYDPNLPFKLMQIINLWYLLLQSKIFLKAFVTCFPNLICWLNTNVAK